MRKMLVACIIGIVIVMCLVLVISLNHLDTNRSDLEILQSSLIDNRSFSGSGINSYSFVVGNITIDMDIPDSPVSMRIYRGYFDEGDLIENDSGGFKRIKNPIPVNEAPSVAQALLSPYGGLPADAHLFQNFIMYGERLNRTTHEVIERIPTATFVAWDRNIDGIDIEGDCDIIQVAMGENGTPIRIYKRWRTYEPIGNVSLISASEAIAKFTAGDVLEPGSFKQDVSIYEMHISYYIPGLEEPEVITEPIWVFYGNATGNNVPFYVYARQFANFTATPTTGPAPLNVTFTDISDALPTRWYWDFGDGTNSTLQNATHTYESPGSYNVTLQAWNDLGSDTVTRADYIIVDS